MATLTGKLQLTSSDLLSQNLSLSVNDSFTVTEGGVEKKSITATVAGSAETIAAAADYAVGTYVYLKNTAALNSDKLFIRMSGADQIVMEGGEWAFFPWSTDADITVYATTTGTLLEFGVFS